MKHSDIQVTAPAKDTNQFLKSTRKIFFLAGYLALMAVATGIASPKSDLDSISVAGLNPLQSWPSPLIMKCDEAEIPSPLRAQNLEPRTCTVADRLARDDLSENTADESARIDRYYF